MDERQKTIRNLELRKQDEIEALDRLFEEFGEILFSRIEEGRLFEPPVSEGSGPDAVLPETIVTEYRTIQQEITDSNEYISTIENDVQKLKELDEEITLKEKQKTQDQSALSASYVSFGEIILLGNGFEEDIKPYRDQMEALNAGINSMEERLDELEELKGKGVLNWIGKNAEGLLVRSRLGKNRDSLQRLYSSVGEKFTAQDAPLKGDFDQEDLRALRSKIEENKQNVTLLGTEISTLKGRRRKLGEVLGAEGNPQKRIQSLEKHILHSREQLRKVYCRFGKAAALPALKDCFSALLEEDDGSLLEKAALRKETIRVTEEKIEKLKLALAIDAGKGEIEKLRKAIDEHRMRIASEEKNIAGLEEDISKVEKYIRNLMEQLQDLGVDKDGERL